jgi:CRISPR-associated protein Cmr2
MKDFYATLAHERACPAQMCVPVGCVSGFVEGCTTWSTRGNNEKNDARRCYLKHIDGKTGLSTPPHLGLEPDFRRLPAADWIGVEVAFTLQTPWYSRDDRPFHVLDNPVRKDRVFGVPFMAPASWKGLLRWACRMRQLDNELIHHLFGNEKGEDEAFRRGALAFYPTWFDRLGFEVINPHSRKTRAGTQPIYYEVVPIEAIGTLRLLYAPLPGREDGSLRAAAVTGLIHAVDDLLRVYGISAKRTVGWGTAKPDKWTAYRKGEAPVDRARGSDFATALEGWLGGNA